MQQRLGGLGVALVQQHLAQVAQDADLVDRAGAAQQQRAGALAGVAGARQHLLHFGFGVGAAQPVHQADGHRAQPGQRHQPHLVRRTGTVVVQRLLQHAVGLPRIAHALEAHRQAIGRAQRRPIVAQGSRQANQFVGGVQSDVVSACFAA